MSRIGRDFYLKKRGSGVRIFSIPVDPLHIGGNMQIGPQLQYIYWEALFWFGFPKHKSFYEAPVSLGPFMDINDFLSWRNAFIEGIREKESRMPWVKVKILKEERFRQSVEFAEEAEEDGFVEVSCLEPKEEGHLFFSETLQEWMYDFNLPFQ